MKVVGTSIRDDQIKDLDKIASERQVSRSIVIRWAIDAYLTSFYLPNRPLKETIDNSDINSFKNQPAEAAA